MNEHGIYRWSHIRLDEFFNMEKHSPTNHFCCIHGMEIEMIIKAMKMVLNALEEGKQMCHQWWKESDEQTIVALRQAIKQADHMRDATKMIGRNPYGLTDKEIAKLKEKTMKPFDLEAAKRGEPIQCRDGTHAKFIAHVPEANDGRRLIVLINNFIFTHFENGREYPSDTDRDLFMAPKKRTVWVNWYENGWAYYGDSEYDANFNATDYKTIKRIGNRAYPVEIEE